MMSFSITTELDIVHSTPDVPRIRLFEAIVESMTEPELTLDSATPPPLPVTYELEIATGPVVTTTPYEVLAVTELRSITSSQPWASTAVVAPVIRTRRRVSLPLVWHRRPSWPFAAIATSSNVRLPPST